MTILEAVSKNPAIMSGELCFAGTRVPVRILFGYIRNGDSLESFLADYPGVSPEQIDAVLGASLDEIEKLTPLQKSA